MPPPPDPAPPDAADRFRNIAVVRLSAIGDVIFALPAVEALRVRFPRARITWIVDGRARPLLEGHPAVDALLEYPREAWRRALAGRFGFVKGVRLLGRFLRGLSAHGFDLAIDFQGNLKSGLCTWFTRAPVRLGLPPSECREPNWLFTNLRAPVGDRILHRVERDLLVVSVLGVPFAFRPPSLVFRDDDRARPEAFLAGPGSGPGPRVLLYPGTSAWAPHKRWPTESWAVLGRRLARAGARILVAGGPGEETLVGRVLEGLGGAGVPVPLAFTIRELAFLLTRCDLIVGCDTGPAHIAAVLGRPAILLFGPYDARCYYPPGHPERGLSRFVPCSPCRRRDCTLLTCMKEIRVEAVESAALSALAETAPPRTV